MALFFIFVKRFDGFKTCAFCFIVHFIHYLLSVLFYYTKRRLFYPMFFYSAHPNSFFSHRIKKAASILFQKQLFLKICCMLYRIPPICAISGANTKEIIVISLIRILIDGPEVSLNGSPTVSPTTPALCGSEPFPP